MVKITIPDPDIKPTAWKGTIPISSRYTAGVAGEKFFRAMKDESKLLGTSCSHCQITYVPAKMFCERCLNRLTNWVEVDDSGKIFSFSVCHIDLNGNKISPPKIVALIDLGEKVSKMVHLIGEITPEDVAIDMPVKAVWKPAATREGKITDIIYFKPVKS